MGIACGVSQSGKPRYPKVLVPNYLVARMEGRFDFQRSWVRALRNDSATDDAAGLGIGIWEDPKVFSNAGLREGVGAWCPTEIAVASRPRPKKDFSWVLSLVG